MPTHADAVWDVQAGAVTPRRPDRPRGAGLMPDAKGFGGRKRPRSDDAVSLGDIVDGLMREQVFSRGMPVAQLASRWPEIVGERLAGETAPGCVRRRAS